MNRSHLSVDGHYAILTLAAEGLFNPELLAEFKRYLDECVNRQDISALVITGTDKNFSQGLDLATLATLSGKDAAKFVDDCMRAIARLLVFPIPVVAAVNGHAFGLGAMITLACDYAVMRADKGFFCLPEIDIEMNLLPSMNALVTSKLHGKALRDVLLTGKRLGGREAQSMGIVDTSCEAETLLMEAKHLATPMMGKNRDILAALKTGIHKDLLKVLNP